MSNIIDDQSDYINEQGVSMMPSVLKYGVIGGLAIAIYKYFNYSTLFATSSMGNMFLAFLVNLVLFGGLIYLVIKEHRDKELGGYITMGRCLGVGILTIIFASLLGGIFDYVYMAFIDPEIQQKLTTQLSWMYEMMGMDEDQIEDAMEATEDINLEPSLMMSVGGAAIGGAFSGLILSAIIGAFTRKNHPDMV